MSQTRHVRGFTLIELMITVVVVAILAAIAFPNYKEQIARSRRTEAQTILMAGQQWMERFYSENYCYSTDPSTNVCVTVFPANNPQFQTRFPTSPPAGQGAPLYDINVSAPTRDTYTITATRKSTASMASDRCGNMTVDNLGRRSIEGTTYSAQAGATKTDAIAYCWR
jgi:type IV pilus assembly protein PilE